MLYHKKQRLIFRNYCLIYTLFYNRLFPQKVEITILFRMCGQDKKCIHLDDVRLKSFYIQYVETNPTLFWKFTCIASPTSLKNLKWQYFNEGQRRSGAEGLASLSWTLVCLFLKTTKEAAAWVTNLSLSASLTRCFLVSLPSILLFPLMGLYICKVDV